MPTAIVTGASRGLGRALAEALAERGWRLVLDARGAAALEAVRAALAERTEVIAVSGDVADDAHRAALVEACGGELDALVNNAGILGPSPLPAVAELPLPALADVLRTNTIAPLGLVQRALPLLRPGARIVNITSDAAVEPYEGWGGYGAGKAALEHLTRVLAQERPDLRVYAYDPGDMRTQMQQDAFPGEDISDRPPPEESVPRLLRLLEDELPSGRYAAVDWR
ncbi:MAG TPA: SDR family oxidoreductase [Solirubrobacteraceae bacterium]|nr:SDR family oxidoreductase [Solirubrobacteraceae bacterium]